MQISLASSVTRAVALAILSASAFTVSAQTPGQPYSGVKVDDMKALAAKPTPKTADGHPDLNARWVVPETGTRVFYGKTVGNEHQLIFGIPATGDAAKDAAVTDNLNKKKEVVF